MFLSPSATPISGQSSQSLTNLPCTKTEKSYWQITGKTHVPLIIKMMRTGRYASRL